MTDEMKIVQSDLSATASKLKNINVMVYKGDVDTVVGNDTIDKLVAHIPGCKVEVSSKGLGHSCMNHKIERQILADKVKTFFDERK